MVIIKQLKSPRKHTFFLWTPFKFSYFRVSVFLRVSPCLSETRIFAKNSLYSTCWMSLGKVPIELNLLNTYVIVVLTFKIFNHGLQYKTHNNYV